MSRIGKKPVAIPAGVTVEVKADNVVTIKGAKGTITKKFVPNMKITADATSIKVERPNDEKLNKSLHGLTRTLINNMVKGVTEGFEKTLEINGVGYKAAKQGKKLNLSLGYSHPVVFNDPEGIESIVNDERVIVIKGIDKEKVGQYAAEIREMRGPEPYKGKGIKYKDEHIIRKVGKTGKKA